MATVSSVKIICRDGQGACLISKGLSTSPCLKYPTGVWGREAPSDASASSHPSKEPRSDLCLRADTGRKRCQQVDRFFGGLLTFSRDGWHSVWSKRLVRNNSLAQFTSAGNNNHSDRARFDGARERRRLDRPDVSIISLARALRRTGFFLLCGWASSRLPAIGWPAGWLIDDLRPNSAMFVEPDAADGRRYDTARSDRRNAVRRGSRNDAAHHGKTVARDQRRCYGPAPE